MELNAYFDPIPLPDAQESSVGHFISSDLSNLDLHATDIALLFVSENRWSEQADISLKVFENILVETSRLYVHDYNPSIASLGVFKSGNTLKDTETGLSEVLRHLIQHKVLPIVVGSNRMLTYVGYEAFKLEEQIVNICSVDNYLNLDESSALNYVGRIIKEQPNYLFNYSNVGYQTYLVSPSELELADELFFDAFRLGMVRGDVLSVEPVLRSSEIVTHSLETYKRSEFGSSNDPQPNGFYAEEGCQMMRFAGLSEKTKLLLVTDLGLSIDQSDALLIAEMIWCALDGYYSRKSELPGAHNDGFLKYRVPIRDDEFQLIFYKSVSTDRWWMEVPVPPQYANKYRQHHMVPCSYEDYLIATRDDLPERWWKAYKKML